MLPEQVDAAVVRYRDANGHTASTATGDGTLEETLYVTYDGNFNVTGLVQENQTFVERYVYTPYGDRKVLDANFTDDADNLTDYDFQLGHQGLRIDAESGTYYNRARQLHSGLGGFMRRDPFLTEYQDGMSLYQAYRGDPMGWTDPRGMQVHSPAGGPTKPAEIGAAAAAAGSQLFGAVAACNQCSIHEPKCPTKSWIAPPAITAFISVGTYFLIVPYYTAVSWTPSYYRGGSGTLHALTAVKQPGGSTQWTKKTSGKAYGGSFGYQYVPCWGA